MKINTYKKSKVRTELQDEDNDEIDLSDIMTQITGYIKDKISAKESNQFADQIMPLMSQACVSVLGRTLGISATAFLLSNAMTRDAVVLSMCSAFLLLKWVQENKVTLHTIEEEVTQEEIDTIFQKSQANSAAVMDSMVGEDYKRILRELHRQGKITREDLGEIFGENDEDDYNDNN